MLNSGDIRLVLHQLSNMLQPVAYHLERLSELKTDEPIFNSAMQTLPGRMNTLNRVLERLRILSKPLEIQSARVDLSTLLKSVANEVGAINEFRKVALVFDFPSTCLSHADEYYLHIAFRELLLNSAEAAVKSKKQKVYVRLRLDGLQWRIEFEDSGTGIPDDATHFELFHSTKPGSGAGLGLPLALHAVEAHGGNILFNRSLKARSSVCIVLPHA